MVVPFSGVNASSRLGGRSSEGDGVWGGVFPSPPGEGSREGQCPLPRKLFCFVILIRHILVNYEVLNLKYVLNLGGIHIDVDPPTKILGMCPRHPRWG